MIKSYQFIETEHHKLHDNIMAFFNRIEFEEGEYSTSFYDNDFYENIVKHHPKILEAPLKLVFEEIKDWAQGDRTLFINAIRNSNDIDRICKREIVPYRLDDISENLRQTISDLFVKLYTQVLSGDNVKKTYGSLQEHFKEFKTPNSIFKCPTCGLLPAKSKEEKKDDYDHYLAKYLFPFSSVNFKNLIPICTDCNGTEVKGQKDILQINGNRKIFYPYDENHTGISITCGVSNDNVDTNVDELVYAFEYNAENKEEEIESWKTIFKIEDRYQKRAKGKGINWYSHFWHFVSKPKYKDLSYDLKKSIYIDIGITDEDIEFIKLPVIEAVEKTSFARASIQAKQYSMF